MEKHDRIIADLMNALDAIQRKASAPGFERSFEYISGVAEQAMKNANRHRERNADGYWVVAPDRPSKRARA